MFRFICIALGIVFIGQVNTPVASAATLCGVTTHQKFGETRARFGSTLATLRPDGTGHIVLTKKNQSASLGSSHVLRFMLADQYALWQIQLTAVEPDADVNSGFQFSVEGGGKDPYFADLNATQIQQTISINEWDLNLGSRAIDKLMTEVSDRQKAVWSYVTPNFRPIDVTFNLKGVQAAKEWVYCGLGNLIFGTTDPGDFGGKKGFDLQVKNTSDTPVELTFETTNAEYIEVGSLLPGHVATLPILYGEGISAMIDGVLIFQRKYLPYGGKELLIDQFIVNNTYN